MDCGNVHLPAITHGLAEALDVDRQIEHARAKFDANEPSDVQIAAAANELLAAAAKPLATNPKLRNLLAELKSIHDQIIDEISKDELLEAGPAPDAKERAQALVKSFEQYLAENKDEIEALQFFYAQPYKRRLKYEDIRALANAIGTPPRNRTPERLWQAYEQLDKSRVHGASSERLLTDIVERLSTGNQESMRNIGQEWLRRICVPLPPAAEVGMIVDAVGSSLGLQEHAGAAVELNRQRLTRLRQSILTWAFEGKLVDQDPNDEPASVLLDRIRAQRQTAEASPRARKQRASGRQGS